MRSRTVVTWSGVLNTDPVDYCDQRADLSRRSSCGTPGPGHAVPFEIHDNLLASKVSNVFFARIVLCLAEELPRALADPAVPARRPPTGSRCARSLSELQMLI